MTRWQADTDMQRLFRHHTQPIPAPVSARIRRRVMRQVRLLRWERLTAEAINVWTCAMIAAALLWLMAKGW